MARSTDGDKTVLALRHGHVITELRRHTETDTMIVTGYVAGILRARACGFGVIDMIGVGAGVFDRLREQKLPVKPFNASESTNARDRSRELEFLNKRSAAWWNLRELLDPANSPTTAIPPDDLVIGDLTAPHWKPTSAGKIQVESKDDIRRRIGRSTDDGDAVVMAFYEAPSPGKFMSR